MWGLTTNHPITFSGAVAVPRSYFGAGNGQIILDNVKCVGTETSLLQCPHSPIGTHNCNPNEIAGVICGGEDKWRPMLTSSLYSLSLTSSPCTGACIDGQTRLIVGTDALSFYQAGTPNALYLDQDMDQLSRGRVEVCLGGQFGTICSQLWTNQDASVACRSLGYSPYGEDTCVCIKQFVFVFANYYN